MSHPEAKQYLHPEADGELSAEARARLEAHLAECPECRAYADELRALELVLTHALHARWDHRRPARVLSRRLTPRPGATDGPGRLLRLTSPFMQVSSFMILFAFVVGLLQAYYYPDAGPTQTPARDSAPQSAPFVTQSTKSIPDAGLEQDDLDLYRLSDIFEDRPRQIPDDAPGPRRVGGLVPN